jgi:hypothetical protein
MKCYRHNHQQFARMSSLFICTSILLMYHLNNKDVAQVNEIENMAGQQYDNSDI